MKKLIWPLCSDTDIKTVEFLIDNIFVDVFLNTVGIPMGINCATFLADLLLYSYEINSMQGVLTSPII